MSEIGELFHIIHVSDDLLELDNWYKRVFDSECFLDPSYSELEQRDASLEFIGPDYVAEPMAPPGGENESPLQETMLGRFLTRHGQHLHSIAWYATDVMPLWDRLTANGVRVNGSGGVPLRERPEKSPGAIYAHPRDAHCQLEIMAVGDKRYMQRDPRNTPGFTADRWTKHHPLGLQRTSHLTVVVQDLDKASALYENALGARKIHAAATPAYGTDSAFYHVGTETMVELAKPVAAGMAWDDMERNGEIIHAVTFRVKDLAAAEAHMRTHSIGVVERAGETITLDPTDTYGAVMRLTTADLPGDPRV